MDLADWLLFRVTFLVPLLLSLAVHEWAHAFSARLLGDDTAEKLGRVTLNPLAHIDLLGTIILPLLGVPFGWAKPVPVNPLRFRPEVHMGRGLFLTAAAGPFSNVLLAAGCAAVLAVTSRLAPAASSAQDPLSAFCETMVLVNAVLALFNLLPVPPLDGSRIADAFVPRSWRPAWDGFCRMGPVVLVLVLVLPALTGHSLLEIPLRRLEHWLEALKG